MTAASPTVARLRPFPAAWTAAAAVLVIAIGAASAKALAGALPVLAVGCLLAWAIRRERGAAPETLRVIVGPLLPLVALCAWGAASWGWSIEPAASLRRTAELAGILLAAAILFAAAGSGSRPVPARALVACLGTALAYLAIERVSAGAIVEAIAERFDAQPPGLPFFNRNVCAVLLFGICVAAVVPDGGRYRKGLLFVLAGLAALVFTFDSGTAKVAMVAALFVLACARWSLRWTRRALAASVCVFMLGMPLLPPHLAPYATQFRHVPPWTLGHRFIVWDFTTQRIEERPLLGWGLDASRRLPGGKERAFPEIEIDNPKMPIHPHNMPLQIWVELGAVGACLATWAIAAAILRAGRGPDRRAAAFRLALLVAALAIASSGYGAWQPWWLSLVALAGACSIGWSRGQQGAA